MIKLKYKSLIILLKNSPLWSNLELPYIQSCSPKVGKSQIKHKSENSNPKEVIFYISASKVFSR